MLVLTLAGQVMESATAREAVTLNEQVLVEQRFVAVQVTGVVPKANALPLAGVHSRKAPPVMVGLAKITAPLLPQILVLRVAGQLIDNNGACATVTLKVQVLVEQRLVAVQVTGVVPVAKVLPPAGVQALKVPPLTVGLA